RSASLRLPPRRCRVGRLSGPRLVDDRPVGKGQLLASPPLVGDVVDDDGFSYALDRPPLKAMIGRRGGNKHEGAIAGKRSPTDWRLVGIVDVRAQAFVLRLR